MNDDIHVECFKKIDVEIERLYNDIIEDAKTKVTTARKIKDADINSFDKGNNQWILFLKYDVNMKLDVLQT